jgi:pyroglutamyl-peptidase
VIEGLIEEHRPDFYVSLGLATGAPVLRFETTAINRVDFGVADNEGDAAHRWRPDRRGWSRCALRHVGRARAGARWSRRHPGRGLASRGYAPVQPRALYSPLAPWRGPGCRGRSGFLHLPYTPKQVARFLRDGPPEGDLAPLTPRTLPSMPLETQVAALRVTLTALAQQVGA